METDADRCRNELLTVRQNDMLSQADAEAFARGIYGSVDAFSLFGIPCSEFSKHGISVPGRTLIESTTDVLASASAQYVYSVFGNGQLGTVAGIIDPFLGSGNILLHLVREFSTTLAPGTLALGIELDKNVAEFASSSFVKLGFSNVARIVPGDYRHVLKSHVDDLARATAAQAKKVENPICIVFLAPPWASGFSFECGLDLRRTEPSSFDTIRICNEMFANTGITPFYVLQIHERMNEESVLELGRRHSILGRHVMNLSPAGTNVGCLVVSK
eukprot:ANDGO_01631.mRNA.1 hypothetical protein